MYIKRYVMYSLFFAFFSNFFIGVLCDRECLKLDVSITQNVENDGFHRNIRWLVEAPTVHKKELLNSSCKLALRLDVSQGMFVNPDEVADLYRLGNLPVLIDGQVDVEVPAHESKPHRVYVFLNNSQIERSSINLPVHLRYQRGQIMGGYGKVYLKKPSLLVWCPNSLKQICGKGLKVEAPCDYISPDICIWKNCTYQALFDDVELYVPVGDLDHYPFVSIVTLLLGCAGCIYILSLLSTTSL